MKKVMIVIGHSFKDRGCNKKIENFIITEYDICMEVATRLFSIDTTEDIDIVLKSRNHSYTDLPKEINSYNPDYVIELHLNSSDNKDVQGTEHLYYHTSKRSKQMATILQNNCIKEFGYKDRGIKPIKQGDRGCNILLNTKAPCVIAEPFFLSYDNKGKLVLINDLIKKYCSYLQNSIREIVDKNV